MLSLILSGALVGWFASVNMSSVATQGAYLNIGVGMSGALLAGSSLRLLGARDIGEFNLASFAVAIVGAVGLLVLLWASRRNSVHSERAPGKAI